MPATFTQMQTLKLAFITTLLILAAACSRQQPQPNNNAVPTPGTGGEIGWVLEDGKMEHLTDYRGQVLVLDFYATWCAPCRKSIPRLNKLHEKYETQGLRIIGLNVGGADDRVKVPAFAKELQIKYPLAFPTKDLNDLLLKGDLELPQTFIFKPDGQMQARYIGIEDSTSDDIDRLVDQLIKKQ